jgi:hypothetical protein
MYIFNKQYLQKNTTNPYFNKNIEFTWILIKFEGENVYFKHTRFYY